MPRSTPAVLHYRRDGFAVLIAHDNFRADQVRTALAAARIGAVAKAALHAESRLAAFDGRGVARRVLRISLRTAATPAAPAGLRCGGAGISRRSLIWLLLS
jgi:hypothetical protein